MSCISSLLIVSLTRLAHSSSTRLEMKEIQQSPRRKGDAEVMIDCAVLFSAHVSLLNARAVSMVFGRLVCIEG